jgi:hypothetical protein
MVCAIDNGNESFFYSIKNGKNFNDDNAMKKKRGNNDHKSI